MTNQRKEELKYLKVDGLQLDAMDYTLEEWLYLRSQWHDPVGDAAWWNKVHNTNRLTSAAYASYKELGIPDPILGERNGSA